MSYITRSDGEHFVIPSYRDVLSSERKSQLKKEIVALSQNYGEYITMQRKNALQYEIAFSPDTGYLLGESIWHHFKRPLDMIYCEAIPNTSEAILVIVKAGSVYLDGSFGLDNIPEELIVFLTQQNHFEIYTYGDVPLTEHPTEGKFSFEEKAVKSFTVLDKPAFSEVALLKQYRLQLVDAALKANGIGSLPVKQLLTFVALGALAYFAWVHFTTPTPEQVQQAAADPYQPYYDALSQPAPAAQINAAIDQLMKCFSIPGWQVTGLTYANGVASFSVQSVGSTMQVLFEWANQHNAKIELTAEAINVTSRFNLPSEMPKKVIYPTAQIIGALVDRMKKVYPGNVLKLDVTASKSIYNDTPIKIAIDAATPAVIKMIANQLQGLPIVLQGMKMDVKDGVLNGSISIDVLGS